MSERCIMGGPLGGDWHCHGRTLEGELFCLACTEWLTDPDAAQGCQCANCNRPFPPNETS